MNSKNDSKLTVINNRKRKQKQTKQTTRIRTESQKWRSNGGLSVGKNGGKGTGSKHKW